MRVPNEEHLARDWRIHALVDDFRLEDVWALPAFGEADEFPELVDGFVHADPATELPSRLARFLWTTRFAIGARLGWDDPDTGTGARVPSLRDRLPDGLRDAPGPEFDALPFTSLYLLDREFAAEIANRTMHGVMHLGWVPDGDRHRGVMAVYVKPNGLFGNAYMAAIRPFRYRVVYPPAMRMIEHASDARGGAEASPSREARAGEKPCGRA